MTQHLLFNLVTNFAVVVALVAGTFGFKRHYDMRLALASLAGGLSVALLLAGYWLNVTALQALLEWSNGQTASDFSGESPALAGWANLPQGVYDGIFFVGLLLGVVALASCVVYSADRWLTRRKDDARSEMILAAPAGAELDQTAPAVRRPGVQYDRG